MYKYLLNLVIKAKEDIKKCQNINELELIRIQYLGRNGYISKQTKILRNLPLDSRASMGLIINQVKIDIQKLFSKNKEILESYSFYSKEKKKKI